MTSGERRIRQLTLAGATDSFGLACGWTVFNLLAVYRYGLESTGLLNAAMLCGVALAAPVARRVTRRLDGGSLLQSTAAAESVLRTGTLALLYWHAPFPVLVPLVALTNVVAWTGYAAMRAEVACVQSSGSAMTRYVAAIVSAEAIGATVASVLPITRAGTVSADWVGVVLVAYGLTLLPTALVARGSRVAAHDSGVWARASSLQDRRLLGVGAALMLACSGPTLLYVALSARLHGRAAVAGAAVAFAAGSLLAPSATRWLAGSRLPARVTFPLWAAGMIAGWVAAPWSLAGLWFAQLLSGVCLTGFEGAMDTVLAGRAPDGRATAALARGSATRALGGAVSVRLVPLFAAPLALTGFAASGAVVCLAAAVMLVLVGRTRAQRTPARPRHQDSTADRERASVGAT